MRRKTLDTLKIKRLAAAIAIALLSATTQIYANGLGEISVKSALGERLKVEVEILRSDNAVPNAKCFSLQANDSGTSGLPHPQDVQIVLIHNPPRLLITTKNSVSEPAIELAIFYGCTVGLARNYNVLLSPPDLKQSAATERSPDTPVANAPSPVSPKYKPAQTIQRSGEFEIAEHMPKAPKTTKADSNADGVTAQNSKVRKLLNGESPADMAFRLYPNSVAHRDRFLDELVMLNPETLSHQNAGYKMDSGTELRIPPRFVASTRVDSWEPHTSQRSDARTSISPTTGSNPIGMTIEKSIDSLVLSAPMETPGANNHTGEVGSTSNISRLAKSLSSELVRLQHDYPNPPPALQSKMLDLESKLAAIELQAALTKLAANKPPGEEQVGASEAITSAPVSSRTSESDTPATSNATTVSTDTVDATTTAEPAKMKPREITLAPETVNESLSRNSRLLLALAGALATALIVQFSHIARRRNRRSERMSGLHTVSPLINEPESKTIAQSLVEIHGDELIVDTVKAEIDRANQPENSRRRDHEHIMTEEIEVVEIAHILATFGRSSDAIDSLAEFIGRKHKTPEKVLTPALYLLNLYQRTNQIKKFVKLADRLHQEFNIIEINWDDKLEEVPPVKLDVRDFREMMQELAKIPHVEERISQQWGSRECLDYLDDLLNDNRRGRRHGLSVAATVEILNLIALIKRTPQTSSTKTEATDDLNQPNESPKSDSTDYIADTGLRLRLVDR